MTYTVSVLQVNQSTYDDIRARIEALGQDYTHMIMPDGNIDMSHVAIEPLPQQRYETEFCGVPLSKMTPEQSAAFKAWLAAQ